MNNRQFPMAFRLILLQWVRSKLILCPVRSRPAIYIVIGRKTEELHFYFLSLNGIPLTAARWPMFLLEVQAFLPADSLLGYRWAALLTGYLPYFRSNECFSICESNGEIQLFVLSIGSHRQWVLMTNTKCASTVVAMGGPTYEFIRLSYHS